MLEKVERFIQRRPLRRTTAIVRTMRPLARRNETARPNNETARPSPAVHAKDLPPAEHMTAPNTGNAKTDQKYQQRQQKLQVQQVKERQVLQHKQEKDHQRLPPQQQAQAANPRQQQMEQQHQQQTTQLAQSTLNNSGNCSSANNQRRKRLPTRIHQSRVKAVKGRNNLDARWRDCARNVKAHPPIALYGGGWFTAGVTESRKLPHL